MYRNMLHIKIILANIMIIIMNIIFLDFDGVLDTATYDAYLVSNGMSSVDRNGRPIFSPKCISNLTKIIKATDAKVVVTSSWKYMDFYQDLLKMWKERNMPGEMIDVTPNISEHRGDEIEAWLSDCPESCNYVILDDLGHASFNANQLDRLVVINPWIGITDKNADMAIEILKKNS